MVHELIDIKKLSRDKIGERITAAREDQNVKQNALAQKIGISPTILNKIELGRQDVRLDQLGQIANALDVRMDYLLGVGKDITFVDDFIKLFHRVSISKDFFAPDEKAYSPENLIYSFDRDYIVLTGSSALFDLIKAIAEIKGQKRNLLPAEYESRLNAVRNAYKEVRNDPNSSEEHEDSETYFLITGEQIFEIVNTLIKSKNALSEIGI